MDTVDNEFFGLGLIWTCAFLAFEDLSENLRELLLWKAL